MKREEEDRRLYEARRAEDEKRRKEIERLEEDRRRFEEEEQKRAEERRKEMEQFERMKRESEMATNKWRESETSNRMNESQRFANSRKLSDNEESEEEEEESEEKSGESGESDTENVRRKLTSAFDGKEEMVDLLGNVGGSVKLIINHFNSARSRAEAEFRGHDKSCKPIAELTRKNLSTNLSKIFLHQFRVDSRSKRKYHFWDALESTTEVSMFSNDQNIDFYKAVAAISRDYENNNLRFRNFVCRGLNEHALHRWVLLFCKNEAVTCRFYADHALLRTPSAVKRLCELLSHLADPDLPFRLSLDYEGRF